MARRSLLSMILLILMLTIAGASLTANANKSPGLDQAALINSSDPMVLIDQGNSLASHGSYNESIEYYDRAINILEKRGNQSQWQSQEIKKRLKEVVQEYEQLNQTFRQSEREYSPESMMFKGLMIAEESAIMAELPDLKMGLSKGTEKSLNKVKQTGLFVGGLPGKVGVIQDTLDALKWNSRGREEHLQKMQELLNEINSTYKEYKTAKGEFQGTSHILAEVWATKGSSLCHLGGYTEALIAYDKAIEYNPVSSEALAGKGETLKALHKVAEA